MLRKTLRFFVTTLFASSPGMTIEALEDLRKKDATKFADFYHRFTHRFPSDGHRLYLTDEDLASFSREGDRALVEINRTIEPFLDPEYVNKYHKGG